MSLGEEFRAAIALADAAMQKVKDEGPYREGGWSRKEILGHLIDSAAHNHVRFVTAANAGSLRLAEYDQAGCVALHGYGEMAWAVILGHWRSQNELVALVVERIPAQALEASCALPDGSQMSLEELIRDYLRHMAHHVEQITSARS